MRPILFYGGAVVLPEGLVGQGWVLVQDGRIVDLGRGAPSVSLLRRAEPLDLAGAALAPGLLDLHVHGALGCDTMDGDPEALRTMARFYATHGVTGFLATTMTAPISEIHRALGAVREVMATGSGGAALLGAHLEGPFIDVSHAGAQATEHVLPASPDAYGPLLETGVVRILTLAPEAEGCPELIRVARSQGVVVSMGHTGADFDTAMQGISAGVTHATHLYNAMSPVLHRAPGAAGAALVRPEVTCELIVDLVHLHPAVVALALRAKGPEGIALITDGMSGVGMPDGDYVLGGLPVHVQQGVARGANGALAGSTLTLERAVLNMSLATGLPWEAALPMATRVPARILQLATGDIRVGHVADLMVVEADRTVSLTMVRGQVVWRQ
ncbi:MAG: N-acetylglucosamine-6-phosphate deacetylase [Anaerolineae bacterium]|jgi:N-acetylglucosamine-6-phosphate deacetylase